MKTHVLSTGSQHTLQAKLLVTKHLSKDQKFLSVEILELDTWNKNGNNL